MSRILVIDDDELLLTTIAHVLTVGGHAVATATDGVKASKLFQAEAFDLILTDIVMPNRDGLETVMTLRRDFPKVAVVAMSGGAALSSFIERSKTYLELAAQLGAHRTLAKPFSPQQLKAAIAEALAASGTASVKASPEV
ncbi:MAG: response regulator [Opitutus sp.]